eukprot:m.84174 g.84174  ORF g.84174 m.84174 type:complete len:100 (-) comp8710_c0_seq2:576-875(-)
MVWKKLNLSQRFSTSSSARIQKLSDGSSSSSSTVFSLAQSPKHHDSAPSSLNTTSTSISSNDFQDLNGSFTESVPKPQRTPKFHRENVFQRQKNYGTFN